MSSRMSNDAQPLVSVVTPFYNGAQYLRECAESVLAQSYGNFEYLLIDNHSQDGASEIAREMAARDPRVRVIQPPRFLPQVENFNFALEQASPHAAYVKMVAGDDWLYPNCLTEMVGLAAQHPSVAIVSAYRMRGAEVDGSGIDPQVHVLSGRDVCRLHLLHGVFVFGSPTTVLYRADVVRKRAPFFVLGRPHPDTDAAFEILYTEDFGFVHQILTFSRTQPESEMGSRRFFVPEALDRYLSVAQFGARYLTGDEQDLALKKATRWEYSVLAQGFLAKQLGREGDDFWQYHHKGLTSIGERARPELLAAGLVRVVARGLLSPIATMKSLRRMTKKG
ncbi:MAG: glycosyltransferase family 2 protein [Myxococcales bacterium]|nr:MAG: glycosyltransferase family 2 protein [Myxococcales bacterium]